MIEGVFLRDREGFGLIPPDEEVSRHMAAKEGYCVKCKSKREIKDAQEITMKNGRPATQGVCPECGTKIFKIGK